ncbi:unnamed protein product [Cyprideis torosa]|uniref:Uncharacterized protein n=1 Tax=Cyprideis torosa TaxID=163714 RepID=A0A7R8W2H6_9CRUS|nr:unnamed protein product [Cyprideis torosa]CAG0881984.1 unnamed protein product [Cyprideis torosa]
MFSSLDKADSCWLDQVKVLPFVLILLEKKKPVVVASGRSAPPLGKHCGQLVGSPSDHLACPVCQQALRDGEIESHCAMELDRLSQQQIHLQCMEMTRPPSQASDLSRGGRGEPNSGARWETYQRIRTNRQNRLRLKLKRRREDEIFTPVCPGCNQKKHCTLPEFNEHIQQCYRKHLDAANILQNNQSLLNAWEKRRGSVLAAHGLAMPIREGPLSLVKDESEDAEVIVDGEDTSLYGPPQYTEADVARVKAEAEQESKSPRSPMRDDLGDEHDNERSNRGEQEDSVRETEAVNDDGTRSPTPDNDQGHVDRGQSGQGSLSAMLQKQTCHLCRGPFQTPLVSISCWHVNCEKCWLRTLGIKKLCPQCNIVTQPGDLRKIFL